MDFAVPDLKMFNIANGSIGEKSYDKNISDNTSI